MKITQGGRFSNGLIQLMGNSWLENARIAGKVVRDSLNLLQNYVNNKTELTALELSKEIEKFILSNNCQATFKGYKGFPEAVCISINNELVHGIPKNFKFKDGDIISFDLGATYNGSIADAAITCVYGNYKTESHKEILELTKQTLEASISSIKIGNRIGSIGETIFNFVKNNKKHNLNLIQNYGGHGISIDRLGNGVPHSDPFISNKDLSTNGSIS